MRLGKTVTVPTSALKEVAETKSIFVQERGPDVRRFKAAREPIGPESATSLAYVRDNLLAGHCQLRVVGPFANNKKDRISVMVLVAYDADDPNGLGTLAVLRTVEGKTTKRNWSAFGYIERDLWVSPRIGLDKTPLSQVTIDRCVGLMRNLMRLLQNPEIEAWPEPWFVSQLGTCARCGRELTDPASMERGVGPECFDILAELPAVRVLKGIFSGKSGAALELAWDQGVEKLNQMGLLTEVERRAEKRKKRRP